VLTEPMQPWEFFELNGEHKDKVEKVEKVLPSPMQDPSGKGRFLDSFA